MQQLTLYLGALALTASPLAPAPLAAQDAASDEDDVIFLTPDSVPRRAPVGPDAVPSLPDSETLRQRPDSPAGPRSRAAPPSVLVILAHPDDEITIAPVLARIVREGGSVTLVFATSGDVGPGVSGMEPGAELAALREDEARCSAFALGLPEPLFWQLGDGQLATMARAPDSRARQLGAKIAALIGELRPEVVMTWGPDGGYGHADHRMVSNLVTEAVQAMDTSRPELLYPAFPADEGTPEQFAGWAKTHPSLVTDRIRYEFADLEATRIAIDCHQSQFGAEERAVLPDLLHRGVWRGQVHFRLAFPATE